MSASKLTALQETGLARVIDCFDRGNPVFAPSVRKGTRDLSVAVRKQLQDLGLIELYNRVAEVQATRPNEGVPPFLYFRPTAAGRAKLTEGVTVMKAHPGRSRNENAEDFMKSDATHLVFEDGSMPSAGRERARR
jgi:hypothetical protein